MAVEIKFALKPKYLAFHIVLDDLDIEKAFVITPSDDHYPLDKKITVTGLNPFLSYIRQSCNMQ